MVLKSIEVVKGRSPLSSKKMPAKDVSYLYSERLRVELLIIAIIALNVMYINLLKRSKKSPVFTRSQYTNILGSIKKDI
jgi:hypothetical protein